jgi:hypothetical protein
LIQQQKRVSSSTGKDDVGGDVASHDDHEEERLKAPERQYQRHAFDFGYHPSQLYCNPAAVAAAAAANFTSAAGHASTTSDEQVLLYHTAGEWIRSDEMVTKTITVTSFEHFENHSCNNVPKSSCPNTAVLTTNLIFNQTELTQASP